MDGWKFPSELTPGMVVRWATAAFIIALYICIVTAIVLALVGVY